MGGGGHPISMTLLNIAHRDYHNDWPANRHRVYPGLSCQDAFNDSRPVSDKANDRQPLIQATSSNPCFPQKALAARTRCILLTCLLYGFPIRS
jgi:hypothetical protein